MAGARSEDGALVRSAAPGVSLGKMRRFFCCRHSEADDRHPVRFEVAEDMSERAVLAACIHWRQDQERRL